MHMPDAHQHLSDVSHDVLLILDGNSLKLQGSTANRYVRYKYTLPESFSCAFTATEMHRLSVRLSLERVLIADGLSSEHA